MATQVNSVTSTVTVTTWISFIGGHVEVITDKQQQYYILETSHAGVQAKDVEDTARNTGGHLGINKTCEKITSCFYWPGIKSDVIDYIKRCERCQRVNRSALQKSSLELYNIPIPMKVMSQVGIDLMKLCETDRFEDEAGFQYVITAQCYFMKYIEIGALRTKTGQKLQIGSTQTFFAITVLLTFTLPTGEMNFAIWCPKSFTKNVE